MSEGQAPSANGVRGILVTHGTMGAGMLDATRKIAGAPADALVAVSNETMGPDDLVRAVFDSFRAQQIELRRVSLEDMKAALVEAARAARHVSPIAA